MILPADPSVKPRLPGIRLLLLEPGRQGGGEDEEVGAIICGISGHVLASCLVTPYSELQPQPDRQAAFGMLMFFTSCRGHAERQMKVLLRKTNTTFYYVGNDQWTLDSAYAHDFKQVAQAIQFHRDQQLTGLEVVLRYEDPLCDLILPL